MSRDRRLRIPERLTAALDCTGACPRCCGASRAPLPGRLESSEQAEHLFDLLERAGLVFIADDVEAVVRESEDALAELSEATS